MLAASATWLTLPASALVCSHLPLALCRRIHERPADCRCGDSDVLFEEQVIDRATSFAFAESITLITVSAEDLVVLKAFAGRDQDWSDVQSIVTRSASSFDWDHALRELTSLSELRDDTSAVERLSSLQGS